MKNRVSDLPLENTQLRLLVAISLMFSIGGCAMGPTRKPILPASPPASAATKTYPQDSAPKAGIRTPPRVTMSPLSSPLQASMPSKPDAAEPARGASAMKPSNPGEPRPGENRQNLNDRIEPPAGTRETQASASASSGSNQSAEEYASTGSAIGAKPSSSQAIIQAIAPPSRETTALDLPSPGTKGSTEAQGTNTVQVSANQCWGQAAIVPTPKKKVTQLVTEQARTRYKVSQARLRNDKVPVVVKEATQSFKLEQPQFVEVTESVKVQEAYTRLRVEPAEYKTEEKDVLVESARVGLRPCSAVGERSKNSATTQKNGAQCSYEIPAKYRRIKVQTLVKPEVVREEVVPAVYKTITKMVVAEPAKLTPVELPEATVDVPVLNVEAQPVATPEPVQAVTVKVDVTEYENKSPQLTWSRVICDGDLSPELILNLQKGLQREGRMRGTPDGKLGPQTLQAAKDFQSSKGIQSDYITYQLLDWLGIQTSKPK